MAIFEMRAAQAQLFHPPLKCSHLQTQWENCWTIILSSISN